MQTISAEQFKQKYGTSAVDVLNQPTKQKRGYVENLTDAVGGDLARRIDRFGAIQADTKRSIPEKGAQMFGQGAGLAANVLEQTVLQAPGIKQVAGKIGEGMNWITTSEFSPIKHLGDIIGSNKTLQAATRLYDTNPRFKDTVDALGNTVRLGGDISTIVQSANFAANVTNKVIQETKEVTSSIAENLKIKTAKMTEKTPANIMNRVARLNPTDEIKFSEMSNGRTPGQYLVETGNFNEPRKLIINEANKFATSKASVDAELAKLPGVYKVGALDDVLTGLKEKAVSVSGTNVKAPYAGVVDDLIAKNANTGLTMEEINTAKRLYERYVKTGYNKIMNADKVEQATNIDSAIRNWQVEQATKLGFTNISEINKQTQLSKFIVDKLGNKIIGQSGLNGINLTDWIILSGGSPQAISGFLIKKFFSSKRVQARIAEIMNQKEIQGMIKPETSITAENINRRVSPQGLEALPAPTSNFRSSFPSGKPIPVAPKGRNIEITGKQGIIPSKPATPPIQKKLLKKPLVNPITNSSKKQLLQEAKKYKSAEEFVKAQRIKDFQNRVVAGQDLGKEIGKKVNPDGTITLYHGTSKQNAENILKSGELKDGAYFSVRKAGTEYGDSPIDVAKRKFGKDATVIEIRVDARGLESAAAGSEVFAPKKLIKQNDGSWISESIKAKSQLTDIWKEANKSINPSKGFFKGGIKGKIDQSKTYVITDIRNKFVGHYVGDKNSVDSFVKEKLGTGYQYKKMNE